MKMFVCITVERSVLCGDLVGEVFGVFQTFFEDERKSRIKGWRLNRRLAQLLLPAVRAVYEGFQGSRLWRLMGRLSDGMASWFP